MHAVFLLFSNPFFDRMPDRVEEELPPDEAGHSGMSLVDDPGVADAEEVEDEELVRVDQDRPVNAEEWPRLSLCYFIVSPLSPVEFDVTHSGGDVARNESEEDEAEDEESSQLVVNRHPQSPSIGVLWHVLKGLEHRLQPSQDVT